MYRGGHQAKDRAWALTGVVAVHGLLAYALLAGLAMRVSERSSDSLELVEIVLPLPPPPPPPPPKDASKPKGEPSPPNLKAVPTPVVAPPPRIPPRSPIAAAPVPSTGTAPSAGVRTLPGLERVREAPALASAAAARAEGAEAHGARNGLPAGSPTAISPHRRRTNRDRHCGPSPEDKQRWTSRRMPHRQIER